MSGVVPISSSEPITLDRVTTPDEPFAVVPDAKTIALRVAASLAVVIGVLAVVGKVLISTQLASELRRWDESVSSWLARNRSDEFIELARTFSKMADTRPILAMIAVVTIALGTYRRWRAMLFVPIAMLVEISTFLAVNYLVGRPRPDVVKIGSIPKTYSFPSGHVAATLVCWIGAAFLLMAFGRVVAARTLSAIGAVVTAMTGWARIYLGMHHALDVVLGVVMGAAALTIAIRSLRPPTQPAGTALS
jgi:undecaprenyl-diphosphatase